MVNNQIQLNEYCSGAEDCENVELPWTLTQILMASRHRS